MKHVFWSIAVFLLAAASPGQGAQVINYFDDLGQTPVDGLNHGGIVYGFNLGGVPSSSAIYGVPFPADSLIAGTVIAGPAGNPLSPSLFGQLSLQFATPTNTLNFAIALDSAITDSFNLQLYDSNNAALTPVLLNAAVDPACDINSALCFAEVQYSYAGPNAIGRAQLNFSSTQADIFALSTLVYDTDIPEPGSLAMLAGGFSVLAIAVLKRRYFRSRSATSGRS